MSKAIELAKECGLLSDTGHLYADEIETFFRRAQAMALRDAAKECALLGLGNKWFSANDCAVTISSMADELEAGKCTGMM